MEIETRYLETQDPANADACDQRAPLVLHPRQCQFCLETYSSRQPMVAGGTGWICEKCVRSAARLLAAGTGNGAANEPLTRQVYPHLERHFAPYAAHQVQATSRAFPLAQQADLQRALDALLGERRVPENFLGFMGVRPTQTQRLRRACFARLRSARDRAGPVHRGCSGPGRDRAVPEERALAAA